jgi:hypothetical protein
VCATTRSSEQEIQRNKKLNSTLVQTDEGCIIPETQNLVDGLLDAENDRWREMYQQYLYTTHHRMDGWSSRFEIQHTCGNAACCNVKHLQAVPTKPKNSKPFRTDEESQRVLAWLFWGWTDCSMTELGDKFGISAETADEWIASIEEPLARVAERARALGLEP